MAALCISDKASGIPASSCRDEYLPFTGVPIWTYDNLTAEEVPSEPAGVEDANNLAKEPCGSLGLPSASALEAYQDAAHFVLSDQRVSIGVNVRNNELEDDAERARLIRAFDHGLTTPAGYVLPI